MRDTTLPVSHFEALYGRSPDPWHYGDSAYELEKYRHTLEALPQAHYRKGFEVGCSIGVLTAMLASRCDDLLAVEPVEAALYEARRRNRGSAQVRFARSFIPRDWPAESFDLVVLSEVLDYLGEEDLRILGARLCESLEAGGDVVLVHWVGKKGAVAKPDEASEVLVAATADILVPIHQERNARYRIDCLTRRA